ncbi:MAG: hypothetical protein AB8H80_14955 [Planctomycetota bacterium]
MHIPLACQQGETFQAGKPQAHHGDRGDRGPLLTFFAPGIRSNSEPGSEDTWIAAAHGTGLAVSIGKGRMEVLAQLPGDRLLVRDGWPQEIAVTMRRDGSDRKTLVPSAPCKFQPTFIDAQHGRCVFLFDRWEQRQKSLRVFTDGGPPKGTELLDRVETVLATSIEGMHVLRRTEPRDGEGSGFELWFASRKPGGSRRCCSIELGPRGDVDAQHHFDAAWSPDGRHIAIGHNLLAHQTARLVVFDARAERIIPESVSGISIEVSRLSSSLPRILLAWRNNSTLRYTCTTDGKLEHVDWSIRTGKTLSAKADPFASGLSHTRPDGYAERCLSAANVGRDVTAAVELAADGIHLVGEAEPILPMQLVGKTLGGSQGVRWNKQRTAAAAYIDGKIFLVDGVNRSVRAVHTGFWQFPMWVSAPN